MFHLIRWQDIADIIIMSFLAYRLYSWFRHTRAMQVLIGLGILAGVYFVTRNLGLFMTSWILQELGTVLFVLIIVVFQAEIRQALYRFSLLRTFIGRQEGGASSTWRNWAVPSSAWRGRGPAPSSSSSARRPWTTTSCTG